MALSKIRNDSLADTAVHGRRNIFINGAMQVAQRGTSTTGVTTTNHPVDRFKFYLSSSGTFTVSQSTDAPDGFAYSAKMACTTADASLSAGDYDILQYRVEGQDIQHLEYGTSSAKTLTLSFWVKSNLTGNFVAELAVENAAPYNSVQYSISSADTWEYKTVTFSGSTTGSIANDNTTGLAVNFWLASGSTFSGGTHVDNSWHSVQANRAAGLNQNLSGSTSNYCQITGVQLEVGDTATPFEHRSYGEELALCQRYYQDYATGSAVAYMGYRFSGAAGWYTHTYPVEMRAAPTITVSTWQGATPSVYNSSISHCVLYSSTTQFYANSNSTFTASAEL